MTKNVVQQIRRATRRQFTSEEKIRIVLEGLRGEISVAELCRREGTRRWALPRKGRRIPLTQAPSVRKNAVNAVMALTGGTLHPSGRGVRGLVK